MKIKLKYIAFFLITILTVEGIFASEVNVYTSRHYDSDENLYEEFFKISGIKVNVISGKSKALIERIKSEGKNSPADVFITVDAGNLWKVQNEGLFQRINSELIKNTVPENLRGMNDEWVALAKRSRVIFYNPNKISKNSLKNLSYEALSKPEWKGKIAIRSSNNIYNQSLVASLIAKHGIEKTEEWARGFVANFARKPQGNDRAQIIAVANGEADLAIANSYYLGLMLSGTKGEEQLRAAKKVGLHFPNQSSDGTHINISGGGILKNAPNPDNAITFLEFLLSNKAQQHIVNNTYEYPVVKNIKPNILISRFGIRFKENQDYVKKYGKFNSEALKLMDRVGWK